MRVLNSSDLDDILVSSENNLESPIHLLRYDHRPCLTSASCRGVTPGSCTGSPLPHNIWQVPCFAHLSAARIEWRHSTRLKAATRKGDWTISCRKTTWKEYNNPIQQFGAATVSRWGSHRFDGGWVALRHPQHLCDGQINDKAAGKRIPVGSRRVQKTRVKKEKGTVRTKKTRIGIDGATRRKKDQENVHSWRTSGRWVRQTTVPMPIWLQDYQKFFKMLTPLACL